MGLSTVGPVPAAKCGDPKRSQRRPPLSRRPSPPCLHGPPSQRRHSGDAFVFQKMSAETDQAHPRACAVQRKGVVSGSRFPEIATTSLGVLQPWPLPSSRLVSQEISCHDHIPPSLRTTCRTAAASPRTIPRNAGAPINQAAGHAVIWGGTLGVRRDAQGARDGELSVPRRRRPVCAIDHILKNRKHLTRIELTNTTTITEVMEWS